VTAGFLFGRLDVADNTVVKYSGDWIFYQGAAASGALLYVYDAGTTDLASIYTDKDLLVASANPVTADSGGLMPFAYRGTSAYKVVLKTSSGTTIDTEDNLPGALDTSTFAAATYAKSDADVAAKTSDYTVLSADLGTILNVNPTSASVTITLISAVTATNGRGIEIRHTGTANQVNIATVSGQTIDGFSSKSLLGQHEAIELVSDGANWHVKSDANRTVYAGTVKPQGYLTPTSATPIITSDVSAATSIYYTPFMGNLVPVYDGTRWVLYEFSELTLTLASQHLASNIYDVFVFLNSGTLTIGTGPSWADGTSGSVTAGSCARGTGTGGAAITRTKGLWLNTAAMTMRNGSTTYSIAASRATYVGSLFIDSSAGQVTCHTSYGQSRKWGVWNAYNRQPIRLLAGDATASWTYNGGSIRQSRGDTTNKLTTFCGLSDAPIIARFRQRIAPQSGNNGTGEIGIGWNSTSAFSGSTGYCAQSVSAGNVVQIILAPTAEYLVRDGIGINAVNALENGSQSSIIFTGTEASMRLTAEWEG
jgi:hypothetical protein